MPGIAGFIGKSPANTEAKLRVMVDCLAPEPFYVTGAVTNERLETSAGWAVPQGSFADCLPAWNEARTLCLIWSGEHYGNAANENAASLIRQYEELGAKFFGKLNGIFSGVLFDIRDNKVVLFNDRYGLNRIYCHEKAGTFHFSSEAKSLLKVLPELRKLDEQSFAEFFVCGCPLQNRSLFQGVHLLPPGSAWTFRPGQPVKKETYFQRETWDALPPLATEDYYGRLRETFSRVLPRYLRGPQKVALSLTGGLDSRMIIAAAKLPPFALPCYTFGGKYRECADVLVSRQVAEICRQPHHVLEFNRDFFSQFPALAMRSVYHTDGAMDVSGAVGIFYNRLARATAPVRLTGNYGGEVLRGYVPFRPGSFREEMFDGQFTPHLRRVTATYAAERPGSTPGFVLFKQVPWHHYGNRALEQSQLTIRSPFLDNELAALAFQAPTEPDVNKDLAHRLIEDANPELKGVPTDRGRANGPAFLPKRAWNWCQEFLPRAEYVYDYGMPQWLAKADRVFAPLHFEKLFLGRQKYYHFRTWYRHELAACVKEVLLDSKSLGRPYLNRRSVESMVRAHVNGSGNYTLEIHKLMTAEFLQRQLIESA